MDLYIYNGIYMGSMAMYNGVYISIYLHIYTSLRYFGDKEIEIQSSLID